MSLKGIVKLVTQSLFGSGLPMRKVGEKAPEFSATDHTGAPISMSGFRGRYVVLWFFPKADTPG
jgi:peroxiredoxin Q/BCP